MEIHDIFQKDIYPHCRYCQIVVEYPLEEKESMSVIFQTHDTSRGQVRIDIRIMAELCLSSQPANPGLSPIFHSPSSILHSLSPIALSHDA